MFCLKNAYLIQILEATIIFQECFAIFFKALLSSQKWIDYKTFNDWN